MWVSKIKIQKHYWLRLFNGFHNSDLKWNFNVILTISHNFGELTSKIICIPISDSQSKKYNFFVIIKFKVDKKLTKISYTVYSAEKKLKKFLQFPEKLIMTS